MRPLTELRLSSGVASFAPLTVETGARNKLSSLLFPEVSPMVEASSVFYRQQRRTMEASFRGELRTGLQASICARQGQVDTDQVAALAAVGRAEWCFRSQVHRAHPGRCTGQVTGLISVQHCNR